MGLLMKFMKLSGVMEHWMGFWETEWGWNGVGQKRMGLPEKSMGFTFYGAVTGGRYPILWVLQFTLGQSVIHLLLSSNVPI